MTDFSNYLIISDLDGTFFDSTGLPVPRNLEALKRFRAGGGMFTLASGRGAFTVSPFVDGIETLLNAPAALCNGTHLYDFATGTAHMEEFISPKDVQALLEFFEEYEVRSYLRATTRKGVYYDDLIVDFSQSMARFCDPSTYWIEPNRFKWPRTEWYKLVACLHSSEQASALHRALADRFGNRFTLTTASAKTVEILCHGISKATGIEKLRRFSPQTMGRTVIACGDFLNDVEMLLAADIAVCPANAHNAAKAVADYILCDHNNGVIADIIEALEVGDFKQKRGQTV